MSQSPLSVIPGGNEYFQFAPFPILRFGKAGELLWCSQATEGVSGFSSEQLLEAGDSVLRLLFLYDFERIKNAVTEIFTGIRSFYRKGEVKFSVNGGETRTVNLTMYPLFSGKELCAAEMLIEDITELKQLRSKVNEINRDQLLQDITRGFLHSQSSSINAIMSRTQLLLQLTDDPEIRSGIDQIEKAALSMGTQVRRIRNSIGNKGYFYRERTESLSGIIEDSVEFSKMHFKVEAREKHRTISMENNCHMTDEIRTDTGLLREIIVSVILRVSAFIEKKGIINLSAAGTPDLIMTVSAAKDEDSTPVRLSKLVNVFSGLDIRQSADSLGIKLYEEESPAIYAVRAVFPARLMIQPVPEQTEAVIKPENMNIMIVEPENALRSIISGTFETLGNRISIQPGGTEALASFRKEPADILIADYDITGLSGLELAARVKEIREDAITVILSGWAFEDMTAYKNVADLVMTKPFQLQTLLKKLSQILEDSSRHSEESTSSV